MRDEILVGLRNALEKGENLDKAIMSFINAGYNPFEVREAAQLISGYGSASSIVGQEQAPVQQETNQIYIEPKKEKVNKSILIAGVVLSSLILLSAIGFLIYIFLIK